MYYILIFRSLDSLMINDVLSSALSLYLLNQPLWILILK